MELSIILTLFITNIIAIVVAKIEEKEKRDLQDKLLSYLERELNKYDSKRNV